MVRWLPACCTPCPIIHVPPLRLTTACSCARLGHETHAPHLHCLDSCTHARTLCLQIDDGLELRKAAFECLDILLDSGALRPQVGA